MPVIGIPVQMLLERIKTSLDRDELVEHLQHLGCDVEGYATMQRFRCRRCDNLMEITETENPPVLCDRCGADFKAQPEQMETLGSSDVIRMELLAVRPDMFEPGGLARVLRNYLGERDEPARYTLEPPLWRVEVDPSVDSDECKRPSIACAIVRNIRLDEDRIKVIMKLQENLHWALGRDRKHASIGVYDLDSLTGPTISYRAVLPDGLRFVPLGFDPSDADSALTPAEILERHPKGAAYARLLAAFSRYPLLADARDQVLSMPPIINSEETRVRHGTRNFFIDVTGSGERIVNRTLNILVTSLAELDPGLTLEQVTVTYGDREVVTPDLDPQKVVLDTAETARTIGVDFTHEEVVGHLKQMGHGVEDFVRASKLAVILNVPTGGAANPTHVTVLVPAYRNDIMHPRDLMEDVAIAYGYHNITPRLVPTFTVGKERELEARADAVRSTLTGLGYLEVITLILNSEEVNYDGLLRPRADNHVLIENPISVEQTMIRTTLLPGILDTLSINTSQPLPQHVFEVGNITLLDAKSETGAREFRKVAAGAIGPRVDYSQIRSTCEALLREFGWRLEAEPDDCPTFVPGRGAKVMACRGDEVRDVGLMGELHPQVLETYKLIHPAAVFEVDLEMLMG